MQALPGGDPRFGYLRGELVLYPMKYPRALVLPIALASLSCAVHAKEFVWPNQGTLALDEPPGWVLTGAAAGDVAYVFKGVTKSGAAAVLQLSVINLPADHPIRAADVESKLHDTVREYINGSVEKKFAPQPIKARQGTGCYVQFTDPNLVGRPPVPDNFKMMRSALISLDDRAVAVVTMQFDEVNRPETAQMLAIASSLTFHRTGKPLSASAPAPDVLQVKLEANAYQLSVPVSRLMLKIPAAGLAQQNVRLGGSTNNPRYFEFVNSTRGLIISGWFEAAGGFKEIHEFWQGEAKAMSQPGLPPPEDVRFLTAGPWQVVAYRTSLQLPHGSNAHIRAELVESGTWIDLHLSMTSNLTVADAQAEMLRVLQSMQVVARSQ